MPRYSRRGGALLVTMVLTLLSIVAVLYLVDAILPSVRLVRGIENANLAYYEARTGIELALAEMSRDDPDYENTASSGSTLASGVEYEIDAAATTIPSPGRGNSEYSSDWNKIGKHDPLELRIDSATIDWMGVEFDFRVPDVDGSGTGILLSWTGTDALMTWTLSGDGKTLVASGSSITIADVNAGTLAIDWRTGRYGYGSGATLVDFYNDTGSIGGLGNCDTSACLLRLTVNRDLLIDPDGRGDRSIPYLEYQITGFNEPIAEQYATIRADGFYWGYRRRIERQIPQFTTSTSIDFTVFQ